MGEYNWLGEGGKELSCLYAISDLDEFELTVSELLQKAANLLPSGFRHSNVCASEIVFDDKAYTSTKYRETEPALHATQQVFTGADLSISIAYLNGKPGLDIDPFLNEEKKFLESVTHQLSKKIYRIQAREKLQKSEFRLKAVIDSQTNYVLITGQKGNFIYYNNKFEEDFGWIWTSHKPEDRNFLDLVMNYHHEKVNLVIKKCMDNPHKVYQAELETKSSKNNTKTCLWDFICLTDNNGVPSEIQCIGIDITERKKAIRQLELNEKLFKSLVQEGSDLVAIVDITGRFKYINPTSETVFGIKAEAVNRENFSSYIHKDDIKQLKEFLKNLPDDKRFEVPAIRIKDVRGHWRWLETTITNMLDEPAVNGFVINSHDVTNRLEYQNKMKQSLEEKEVLLSEIHHRVKNNLSIVSGILQLQTFDEHNEEVIAKLTDSISRIRAIATIHELLYQTQNFSKLQFSEIIKNLLATIHGVLHGSKEISNTISDFSYELNITQAIPCALIINEVITNIYKHAFKDRDTGNIYVNTQKKADVIILEIKDDGVGMPANFNPEESKTMGMQIINILTSQLEANYSFSANENGGTVFRLEFDRKTNETS